MGDACGKLLLIILSVFIPPLAVWIARNKICSCTVCINILLTLLGWVNIFIYKRMTEIVVVFFLCSRFRELFMLGVSSVVVTILMQFEKNKKGVLYCLCSERISILINQLIRTFND
jgi:uncharacterized membrane protein YqaE (UPF0057 family)